MVPATSASTLPRTPACLDIEASGFGRHSYPIEIGYVLADGSAWCTLVRPAPDWDHWDDAAQAVHGITRQAVRRHGRDIAEVAATLNRALRGLTLYCDGWAHDYAWLNRLFDAADLVPAFRLESLRATLDEAQAAAWHATKQAVAAEMNTTRHRASTDARLLQLTWLRLHATAA
jgi:hypothetical protein